MDISPERSCRWPTNIWKDAQHCWSPGRCRLKPRWDVTSRLLEWLSSINLQTTGVGKNVERGSPHALLVGLWIGTATVENSIEVPQRAENRITIWPTNSTSGYLSKETQTINLKRHVYYYVHCSIVSNGQDTEKIWVSIDRQVGKDAVHKQWNIAQPLKKEWSLAICDDMNGPRKYYAKWNGQTEKDKCHMIALICGIWRTK